MRIKLKIQKINTKRKKLHKRKSTIQKKPEEIVSNDLKTKEELIFFLKDLFNFLKKEKKIDSFEVKNNREIIFTKFSIEKIEFEINIIFSKNKIFDQSDISINYDSARNVTLTVISSISKQKFNNTIVSMIIRRSVGIQAENEMFEIFQKLFKDSESFLGIKKATPQEDKEHADFFIKYKISNKKSVNIPIDCKASKKAQLASVAKNGHEHPTINFSRIKEYFTRGKHTFLLEKIKRLCDDYLSNKDIAFKKIHI